VLGTHELILMKNILSEHDRSRLDVRVAETEKRTGIQIVLTVVRRSDSYAELPWKAFALGASAAGLIILLMDLRFRSWYPDMPALALVAGMLAGGALPALLAIMVPHFAKCFLSGYRAEVEVLQYAKSLFLDRELFATRNRRGILLLVSLFERRVVILPDTGLDGWLKEEDARKMVSLMTPALKGGQVSRAFDAGLDYLSSIPALSFQGDSVDGLPDEMIVEEGV
jgi:putative membrane protein